MKNLIAGIFVVVSLLAGCNRAPQFSPPTTSPEIDIIALDSVVYSAYLKASLLDQAPSDKPLLVQSDSLETAGGDPLSERVEQVGLSSYATPELMVSFKERNSMRRDLKLELDIQREHKLVTREDLVTALDGKVGFDAEKEVNETYPNYSLPISFSSIGYNQNRTKALFFVSRWFRDGCFVVMDKIGERWTITVEQGCYIV